jgi:ribonuclease R
MPKNKKTKKELRPQTILKYMAQLNRPVTIMEIYQYFGIKKEKERVKEILTDLQRQGQIIQLSSQRYGLIHKLHLITGRLFSHPDGHGFVTPERGKKSDLFIKPRHLKGAMHGDRVVVRLERHRRGRLREGKIVRILERKNKYLIGRFETDGQVGFLIPEDKHFSTEMVIPLEWAAEAGSGQMVITEIIRYPNFKHGALAKVVKVLGDESVASTQSDIVTYKYDLARPFLEEALKEAETLASLPISPISQKELKKLSFFTIDGENARDFDDAVVIKKENGIYHLFVAIADVAYYVTPQSTLDKEAYLRGNSVYFPDRVLPMLPLPLSQGICSLNPYKERLAIVVEMRFNPQGELIDYKIYESIIQSKARLTYRQVQAVLNRQRGIIKETKIRQSLYLMAELAEILRQKRMTMGSLDFDLPEPEVTLDILGHPKNIIRAERWFSHKIIEEFMIIANQTVAIHLKEKGWPMIYRVHERPEREKIITLTRLVETFGYSLPLKKDYQPIDFQKLLKELKDTPHSFLVNRLFLRALKQARYSPDNIGHFGLALDCYTHFTSPIRRYSDLVVHRLLKKQLNEKRATDHFIKQLDTICHHLSERERIGMEAEREIMDRLRVQFMAERIGEEYEGIISGVSSFGFFVELETIFVEGLVRVSFLHDDYYFLNERMLSLCGKRTHKTFRLGDRVRVRVIDVNTHRQEIELHLIKK